MLFRFLKPPLIGAVIAGVITPSILVSRVVAQKQGAPLWYKVADVNRVTKPNREHTRPAHTVQKAALLTLQWHLLKRGDSNTQKEVNAGKRFETDDQLKLAVTVNQSGYLYIVNRPAGKDAVLLFPDIRINHGDNQVVKDKEYVIPAYCPGYDDPNDCWFTITPPAGKETMLVIFSRDKITTLPNKIDKPNSVVSRSVVDELIASSQQRVKQVTGNLAIPGKKAVRYATRVQNTNPKDNEELIATIELSHGE